jgi:Predicted Fe-S protein
MTQFSAKSPCISVCVLDEEDVCTGCFRTAGEITQWTKLTEDQRREVNARAAARSRQNNPFAG